MSTYSTKDIEKLKQIITEGSHVLDELETLKEGLRDTVKSIGEELGIKPSVLNKAISIAHKRNFHEHRDAFDEVESILDVTGWRSDN